jgi:hypothetical protein
MKTPFLVLFCLVFLLTLAFKRRANTIPGETFPDARIDDSFQKFLLQKEFRQFLNSLYGQTQ